MSEVAHPDSRIIFLGGIFPPSQIDLIYRESRGVIQGAADGLQKSLLTGLASNGADLAIVNLPYVGAYPRGFTQPVFPAVEDSFAGAPLHGQRFVLVRVLKTLHRVVAAFSGLQNVNPRSRIKSDRKRTVVMVYAAHLPFLFAALGHRFLRKDCSICLILPDLPEFMGDGGRLYKIVKSIDSNLFYKLAKRIDYFVVLTAAVADRLGLAPERFVIVEGIADNRGDGDPVEPGKRAFLYTGTLARRYGVIDLLEAFQTLDAPNAELWICGEGDGAKQIENAAATDPRIKFFGQVTRDKARELQKQATVLVNPRLPVGEFTKYSFPSKTMEYMAAGRPVLMYRLPGIPEEYHDYFVSPSDNSTEALTSAMLQLIGWSDGRLAEFGHRAREFVLREKNPAVQTRKILQMIG